MPWQRMGWVIWRQHRATLAWVAVFLGALAVAMGLAGHQLHPAYATAVAACQSANSLTCPGATIAFDGTNGFLSSGFILQAVPVLIGALAAAPGHARGCRRVFSLVLDWYYQPYFVASNQNISLTEYTPFFPGLFDLRGIGFAAWTLVAFAIGALAGMLIRRVVPAIVATLAAYAALAFAAGTWLRPAYATPVVTSSVNVRVPVDRGRLAAGAVGAADRRDRVAGPPPSGLNKHLEGLAGLTIP